MNTIMHHIYLRYKELYLLCVSMTFGTVLLMIRMKIHQEFFLLFLVWNLFLAVIPYAISFYLSSKKHISKTLLYGYSILWLAFLPNAPYILTDLIHLKISNGHLLWLDVIIIASFALNGLVLFMISLADMNKLLKAYLPKTYMPYFVPTMIYLTAMGIYIGRFLRYNSWEIIQKPFALSRDILDLLIHPFQHFEAWIFICSLSLFLYVFYLMFVEKASLEFDRNRDFI